LFKFDFEVDETSELAGAKVCLELADPCRDRPGSHLPGSEQL